MNDQKNFENIVRKIGINNSIPESFQYLKNFSTQKVRQRRGQDRYRKMDRRQL